MGHSSSLIGDPSSVGGTSGVSRCSSSSTMSILRQYFGRPTHRYGLSVFQASETMAAHQRGDPGSSLVQVAFLMVLLAGFQGPSKINIYFKALDPLHGIYDYLMSTKK